MSRKRIRNSGRAWIGSLVLVAGGMAVGALLYAWLIAGGDPELAGAKQAENPSEHKEEVAGLVRIPVDAQKSSGLEIQQAAMRPIETSLQVTGTVAPDQTRIAHIRPLARGVVEEVFARLGDRVKEGDSLISYDNIELGMAIGEYLSARADLRSSQTDLEVKETILARSREMLEVGAVARTTHDIREAEFRDAEAQVNSARAREAKFEEQLHRFGRTDEDLLKLGQGDEEGYHRTASHSVLRAPSSGIVTAYDVAVGETVDPSSELLTLTDISTVWVLADVYEENLGAVRMGKEVSIRVASYPGEVFRGRITYISDLVEPKTRTAQVRCVVSNPTSRLKLDMFATVEIPTEQTADLLAIPTVAIQRIDDRPVVFVKRSETDFEQREVVPGTEAGGWIEIRRGLKPGESVITTGSFYAKTAALRELIGDEH